MNECPVCGGRETGKIGNDQYYCSTCCIEYNAEKRAYSIEEDGTLVEICEQP